MKHVLVSLSLLLATSAFAQEEDAVEIQTPNTGWMCEAKGQMMSGSPGQGIWMSVYGYGPNQYQAASDAIGKCNSRGLQQCMVGLCGKR